MDNSGPDTVVFIPLRSNKLNLGKGETAEIPDDSKKFGFVQIVMAKGKNKVIKKVQESWMFADYSKTGSFKTSVG